MAFVKQKKIVPACASYASQTPEPEQQKPKITADVVNDYIEQNPEIVSNCLRNERALKAQRKQMNARSLLTMLFSYFISLYYIC